MCYTEDMDNEHEYFVVPNMLQSPVYGPFSSKVEAVAWATFNLNGDWWVAYRMSP